ncbi:MAG: phosphoserine phosphatase SerB [Pseudodesulfovibrio sp.]|uniref:Phosphoserine phosphatase n=1 Tax=Pseudodesulfovibrio aespoeensis (strain ATCC 700646 / DSM 10631 / Aspo-2) TaxID=643562 RepID=E6VZG2_PSEA9|nr:MULTISPECIES: phosphoserine phosphatase SerB [Pseudodesulfovibrio]MBU4191623.1 phosphoserine phosphatase SerB [Pseudomonadota bacterium]ADU61676.1 phosphoserine phosphatase SerB [Pseudodesulfovibrio aespoeensis Aspo-2]MBU4377839.1 phosphoserine phosphatase SerB [Pseudomonadota bacterium]MBU4474099.1 phosphoserine phosphatase SerB [Pseudomonadota bacterium]MBU4517493.1 phosphoserine phosphatase SerB [Pseudomonadota bacterium]
MEKIILVHVTGNDRPGLTAELSDVLAGFSVDILDIGQVVIHNFLTLGILIRLPANSQPVLKDLLFKAHELGVTMKLHPLDEADYTSWVGEADKQRHIITLLARSISAEQIAAITAVVSESGLNIDTIHRLSGRVPLTGRPAQSARACVEFTVRGTPRDMAAIRSKFLDISADLVADIAFQEDNIFRRNRRLVAFDMDSTLIQAEVIDELAKVAGVGEEVAAITEAAMRGELDFKQSLRKRLSLLKGLDESVLREVAARLPLTEGAERLISTLKNVGYKIAILSGGFTYFGNILKERLGIDYVYANELEIVDGKLTGRALGEIVDAQRKAELLQAIADQEGISLQQVIAVGDGANDLPMLNLAGLGIAFHAKPKVKKGARQAISTLGLDSILYLIGVRDRDVAGE